MIRITQFLNLYNILLVVLITFIGVTIYENDRQKYIDYLTSNVNQTTFRLEGIVKQRFNTKTTHQLQQLLDKYATSDIAIENIILIDDATENFYSAKRSVTLADLPVRIAPINTLSPSSIEEKIYTYDTFVTYLKNNQSQTVRIILQLNKKQLTRAPMHWFVHDNWNLYLWVFILTIGTYFILYRLFYLPLVRIIAYVQHNTNIESSFMLKEFRLLYEALKYKDKRISQYESELLYSLTVDTLTQLPNRYAFLHQGHSDTFGCALIDIEGFSKINDVYGQKMGDLLLLSYAQWLQAQLKSPHSIDIYKFASDEYLLVFTKNYDLQKVQKTLTELIESTSEAVFTLQDIEIALNIHIGFARTSETTLEDASIALKTAKEKKSPLIIYDEAHLDKSIQLHNIEIYKLIRESVQKSYVKTFFQPIICNTTQQILKYEALIRIQKEERLYLPHEFLNNAKHTKYYSALTQRVLEQVIERLKYTDTPISVNLSIQDILDPLLTLFLEKNITKEITNKLVFEILESEGIEQYNEVSAFVEHFKAYGIQFAIDDFGSGYSNFNHLLKLNVDILKIDGSLIQNINRNPQSKIIVKNIVQFAKELHMQTIAEFVSDETIFESVKELGIDMSQGYFFGKPQEGFASLS